MASPALPRTFIPGATYRLQFHAGFTLEQGRGLARYLNDLGITHCYASPLFQARPGSTHGYDVSDFSRINRDAGGETGLARFSGALRDQGLGLIMDLVPNHMGVADPANGWWWDVLEHGPASRYAGYFDIDWRASGLEGRVLLPVLGERFGVVLEAGQIRVVWENDRLRIAYHDRRFPMSFEACSRVFESAGFGLERIARTCRESSRPRSAEQCLVELRERIVELLDRSPEAHGALKDTLARINGSAGQPASFDELERVLAAQHYRLAFWKLGPILLNYRRFFDITDLAGVRVEREEVFEDVHRLALELVARDLVHGVRVDHPDGLWDPAGYFERLQRAHHARQERAAPGSGSTALYVVAEKILAHDEGLPEDWPVHGTTGYDFLNLLNGLFIVPEAEAPLDAFYRELADGQDDFNEVVRAGKLLVMTRSLAAELTALAASFEALTAGDRYCCDFTPDNIREGLSEWIASLAVYRTYLRPERPVPSAAERRRIKEAGEAAVRRRPDLRELFHYLTDLFLRPPAPKEGTRAWEFIMRLQQLSGPVMAKGVEDTAFYRFNRFLSLNEVGGDPRHFGVSLEEFHRANTTRLGRWPHSLLATSTHDTKRSEDVRARLNVLSELPGEWVQTVRAWRELNAGETAAVDANTEYVLYQTLVGMWPMVWPSEDDLPVLRERVWQALRKSVREAKLQTSWLEVDGDYESSLERLVARLFGASNPFWEAFRVFHERVAYFGRWNSLSQVLLKATAPGVPDFYQGSEVWDLSLVDPDNRRDVDYTSRQQWLDQLRAPSDLSRTAQELVKEAASGRIKLFLTARVLNFRRAHHELFARGSYEPVRVSGKYSDHVIAFMRREAETAALVVAPRWTAKLTQGRMVPPMGREVWGDTTLEFPEGCKAPVCEVITGQQIPTAGQRMAVADVLARFPVGLVGPVGPVGSAS